jgi:predicted outer membrane repeat protein
MGLFGRKKKSEQKKVKVVVVKEKSEVKNFRYLNDLIRSGEKEINLNADIVLSITEKQTFKEGFNFNGANKNLIINGNGHTIDARGKTKIFDYFDNNLTLKNIILKNGFSENHGAAISTFHGNLNIDNCKFINNIVEKERGEGGAIYNNDANITITRSKFINNMVIGEHGDGGAIYNGNTLTLKECEFNTNVITGRYGTGGAIHGTGTLNVSNCEFTHNIAKLYGGAIYGCDGTVKNSKFRNIGKISDDIHFFRGYKEGNEYVNDELDETVVDLILQKMIREIRNK